MSTPIATIDRLLTTALENLTDADPAAVQAVRDASTIVDRLLRVDLTDQTAAIEELKEAHQQLERFYDT